MLQDHIQPQKMAGGSGCLSLQELCESAALAQILLPDFKDADFASLEPRLQQLLVAKMRSRLIRFRTYEQSCPQTDFELYRSSSRIKPAEESAENKSNNLQARLREVWSYKTRRETVYIDLSCC